MNRCPYDKTVCANNAPAGTASAVGECIYCERDRLKGELRKQKFEDDEHFTSVIVELEAEVERLKAEIAEALHDLEVTRVWNGQGWTYPHPRLKTTYQKLEAAVKAGKEKG